MTTFQHSDHYAIMACHAAINPTGFHFPLGSPFNTAAHEAFRAYANPIRATMGRAPAGLFLDVSLPVPSYVYEVFK